MVRLLPELEMDWNHKKRKNTYKIFERTDLPNKTQVWTKKSCYCSKLNLHTTGLKWVEKAAQQPTSSFSTLLILDGAKETNISDCKESTCNTEDLGSIPGLGRSPGGGQANPLQYSCLENPHGQRSLAGCNPCGCKESNMTEWLSTVQHKKTKQYPGTETRVLRRVDKRAKLGQLYRTFFHFQSKESSHFLFSGTLEIQVPVTTLWYSFFLFPLKNGNCLSCPSVSRFSHPVMSYSLWPHGLQQARSCHWITTFQYPLYYNGKLACLWVHQSLDLETLFSNWCRKQCTT